MKKILAFTLIFFSTISSINAEEIKRIFVGNEDAKITIIAFESLTCSHCANFHKDVYPQLKEEYLDTGLAKIEFRHFPLDVAAFNASKVSQCKNDGDSAILNSLYANQQKWVKGSSVKEANENLQKFLVSEGFDLDFEKCINNKEIEDFVLNDRIDGVKKFKVNATPTIVLNAKKFEKTLTYKNLKKIQLNGFKSFADKTNFLIEEGLTGIVGPNGCGKSNIVESLRWVMGETSAKSMRGSGMEDVIFNGTSNKASKNIAEVSIDVENKNNEGPVQYRDLDQISVRRKIEKDKGSKFYINDKEVRARDAQMFFADLSTGAHSPSMISQGRIGALVTAKPTDRRAILEEAARISGLHVRRHEAELRLNAAESNLKRADELRRQQERQLANLQKQAEEATKYKLISEEIKKVEAGLYYLRLIEIEKEIT